MAAEQNLDELAKHCRALWRSRCDCGQLRAQLLLKSSAAVTCRHCRVVFHPAHNFACRRHYEGGDGDEYVEEGHEQ